VVADVLPRVDAADWQALIQAITAGHLSAATLSAHNPAAIKALALTSFASSHRNLDAM
jgi:hypothetical protein